MDLTNNIRSGISWTNLPSLLLVLALAGCLNRLAPNEQLYRITESEPGCSAPCWRGITPGVSTEADFSSLVEASPAREFDNIARNELRPEGVQYIWQDRANSLPMEMKTKAGVVRFVSFLFGGDLPLSSILETIGSPDAYTARFVTAEVHRLLVGLYYPDLGIFVDIVLSPYEAPESAKPPSCKVDLGEDTPVHRIYYVAKGTIEDMNLRLVEELVRIEQPRPWKGLGQVSLTSYGLEQC